MKVFNSPWKSLFVSHDLHFFISIKKYRSWDPKRDFPGKVIHPYSSLLVQNNNKPTQACQEEGAFLYLDGYILLILTNLREVECVPHGVVELVDNWFMAKINTSDNVKLLYVPFNVHLAWTYWIRTGEKALSFK